MPESKYIMNGFWNSILNFTFPGFSYMSRQDDPSNGLLMGIPGHCRNSFVLKQVLPNLMVCHGLLIIIIYFG